MRHLVLFYAVAAIAAISVVLAVYFLIPGIYHPYVTLRDGGLGLVDLNKHPSVVKSAHRFYAVAFLAFAVILVMVAYLFRPKKIRKGA